MRRARRNPAEYFRTSHTKVRPPPAAAAAASLSPETSTVFPSPAPPHSSLTSPLCSQKKNSDSSTTASHKKPNRPSAIKMAKSNDAITNPEKSDSTTFARSNTNTSAMRQTVYQPISTVSISRHNSQRTNKHATNKQAAAAAVTALRESNTSPSSAQAMLSNSFNSAFSGSHSGTGSFEVVIQVRDVEQKDADASEGFWDATDTHHMLPIFASARAYVPSSFESLLVQSFFNVLTPLICEKLVCGQFGQAVLQIEIPPEMIGKRFVDMYRVMSHHHVSSLLLLLVLILLLLLLLFLLAPWSISSNSSDPP
jgi:hypothetical protein